jgi:hypothetical protein
VLTDNKNVPDAQFEQLVLLTHDKQYVVQDWQELIPLTFIE